MDYIKNKTTQIKIRNHARRSDELRRIHIIGSQANFGLFLIVLNLAIKKITHIILS